MPKKQKIDNRLNKLFKDIQPEEAPSKPKRTPKTPPIETPLPTALKPAPAPSKPAPAPKLKKESPEPKKEIPEPKKEIPEPKKEEKPPISRRPSEPSLPPGKPFSTPTSSKRHTSALPMLPVISQPADETRPASLSTRIQTGQQAWSTLQILDETSPRTWSTDEELLVRQVADQLSLALENARLFQQAVHNAERYAVLHRAGQEIVNAGSDLESIYLSIHKAVAEIMPADVFMISMLTKGGQEVDGAYLVEEGERFPNDSIPIGEGVTGYVIKNRKSLRIEDIYQEEWLMKMRVRFGDFDKQEARSNLTVPMLLGDKAIGVISAQSYGVGAYSVEDQVLLETLASEAAIAIENARLFQETRDRADELAALNSIVASTSQTLELEQLLQNLLLQILKVIGFSCGLFSLYDADKQELILITHHNLPEPFLNKLQTKGLGGTLCEYVFKTNKSLGIGDLSQNAPIDTSGLIANNLHAYIGVPLEAKGRLLGTLCIFDNKTGVIGDRVMDLARTVGIQIGFAIENANLFKKTVDTAERNAALNRTSQEIVAAGTNLESVYSAIHRGVAQVMPADAFMILTIMPNGLEVESSYFVEKGVRYPKSYNPIDAGVTGKVIQGKKSRMIDDLSLESEFDPIELGDMDEELTRSAIWTPLLAGNKVIGAISTQCYKPKAYSPEDLSYLETLASEAAIAIENARLFQETRDRADELAALNSIVASTSQTLELEQLLGTLLLQILHVIGFSCGLFSLYDEDKQELILITHHNLPEPFLNKLQTQGLGGTLCEYVFKTNKPLGIGDLSQNAPIDTSGLIANNLHAYIGVPLEAKGRLLGTLCAFDNKPGEISDRILDLARSVGIQIGFAIENANLFKKTVKTAERNAALNQASQEIVNAGTDLEAVYAAIHRGVAKVMSADAFLISTVAPDGIEIEASYLVEKNIRYPKEKHPIGEGIQGKVIRERKSFLFKDETEDEASAMIVMGNLQDELTHAMLWAPLISGNKVTGVISVQSYAVGVYTMEDLAFLETLASEAAIAIENARLFEQTTLAARQLQSVSEITTASAASFDLQKMLEVTAQLTQRQFGLYHCHIFLLDDDNKTLSVKACGWEQDSPHEGTIETRSITIDQPLSIVARAARTHEAVILNSVQEGTGWLSNPNLPDIESEMAVPLLAQDKLVGVLNVHARVKNAFTSSDAAIMSTLAAQIGTAIQNSRLFQEVQELNQAIQSSNDAMITTTVKGIITQVNPAFTQMSGYTEIEAIGHTPALLKSGMQDNDFYKGMWETILTGEIWRGELINRRKDGSFYTIDQTILPVRDNQGNLTGFMAIERDISERKKAEEALKRQNEYLEASAEIGRLVTSTLDLNTIFSRTVNLIHERFGFYHAAIFTVEETGFNAVLREATGQAGVEMKQRNHKLAVDPNSIVGKVTSEGKAVVVNDTALDALHKFNPLLPDTHAEAAIPMRVGNRIIGALDIQSTVVNDFSEDEISILQTLADQVAVAIDNARSYELSQGAVKEMREIDRLKSQFLANMSHELRTPLNSIIGFSRVILKGIDGPITELEQQDLTAIYNSGQHLLSLINDILDHSKIDAGKMELAFDEVNIADITNSVLSTMTGLIKDKPITLKRVIQSDLPTVRADAIRIRQVMLNLLSNAAKFTTEGEIVVEVAVKPASAGRSELMVSVTDTGPGILPEDQNKLFQPFSQVDDSPTRRTGGTGLGLSISRHLVEMHGGRIGVESVFGKGSTFYFTLPLSRKDKDVEWVPPNGKVILAIDDDPQVIGLYERYLQPQGYQVVALTDPSRAIDRVRQLKPYAVTLDIMMPGIDGWHVLSELKSNPDTRETPVIICSILEDQEKGFSLGAADYLVKPILEEDLVGTLDRLNQDGSIREVLVIDDDPNDLRLMDKMLKNGGRYKPILAQGGVKGWEIISSAAPPHAVILDLFMPEMNGFKIMENMRADKKLAEIPVIVVSGMDLTAEQQKQLIEFGQHLLKKGSFTDKDLFAHIQRALQKLPGK